MNLRDIVFGTWKFHSKVVNRETKAIVNSQEKPVDILKEAYPSLHFDAHKREHILNKILDVLDKRMNESRTEEKLKAESEAIYKAIQLEEKEADEFSTVVDSIVSETNKGVKKGKK